MSDEKDDTVGYKKPPKHSQFKKGQSGNRSGRPKKKLQLPNLEKAIAGPFMKTVTVIENGKARKFTKFDVMMTQLVNKAASGHMQSIKTAVGLLERGLKLGGTEAEGGYNAKHLYSARERITKRLEQMARRARQEDDEGVDSPAGAPDKKDKGDR